MVDLLGELTGGNGGSESPLDALKDLPDILEKRLPEEIGKNMEKIADRFASEVEKTGHRITDEVAKIGQTAREAPKEIAETASEHLKTNLETQMEKVRALIHEEIEKLGIVGKTAIDKVLSDAVDATETNVKDYCLHYCPGCYVCFCCLKCCVLDCLCCGCVGRCCYRSPHAAKLKLKSRASDDDGDDVVTAQPTSGSGYGALD